jgi:hypothetical protein
MFHCGIAGRDGLPDIVRLRRLRRRRSVRPSVVDAHSQQNVRLKFSADEVEVAHVVSEGLVRSLV